MPKNWNSILDLAQAEANTRVSLAKYREFS